MSWRRRTRRWGPLAERLRGLRPPRYQSLFEALTNAITCQQITLTAGIRILARLADRCGVALGDARSFPQPAQVACLSDEEFRGIGYSRQKARAMIELSALAQQDRLDGDHVSNLPDEEAVARLRELYGVGRWTAEYALLRGDGRLQIFPGDDVGVRRRLEQWLGLKNSLITAAFNRRWRNGTRTEVWCTCISSQTRSLNRARWIDNSRNRQADAADRTNAHAQRVHRH